MNALDSLWIQVVNCRDYPGDRPYQVVAPWAPLGLLFNAETDPLVSAKLIAEPSNYLPGCYFVPHANDAPPGREYADRCSKRVDELGGKDHVHAVAIDIEKMPLTWQADFCRRWDAIRWGRPTIYLVEPYQDGTQNNYALMLARNSASGQRLRKIGVQTYFGGMQPQPIPAVVDYLIERGLSLDDLMPCTDPAQPAPYFAGALAAGTRGGVLFQAGRIPR